MDYFKKYEENPAEDLKWNLPERKQGAVAVIGGNKQSFIAVSKVAEWLSNYPVEIINVVLPDALKGKVPSMTGFSFLKSTDTGSFAEAEELLRAFETVDYNLLIGDLSKNAVTGRAIGEVCLKTTRPVLVTRDAVDLLLENSPERVLMNQQIVLMASLAQLQKLLRAMYYPKMLTLSQSLVQVAETLHKFTLSYPVKIVTFQGGQILIAESGKVAAVPLEKTGFSPVTLWSGELAVKIMIYNLFNPSNFMDATTSAMF